MAYYYTPFRKKYLKPGEKKIGACVFCTEKEMEAEAIRYQDGRVVENEFYRWIVNFYPKHEGHTMIVPKRHVTELGAESKKAVAARDELVTLAAQTLQKLYKTDGIEVFIQCGAHSMASIEHLHWHVVPALPDDPIRGFQKLGHFYTTEQNKKQVVLFPVPIKLARRKLQNALSKVLTSK